MVVCYSLAQPPLAMRGERAGEASTAFTTMC